MNKLKFNPESFSRHKKKKRFHLPESFSIETENRIENLAVKKKESPIGKLFSFEYE